MVSSKASEYQPMFATNSSFENLTKQIKQQNKKNMLSPKNYKSIDVSVDPNAKKSRLAKIGARILGDNKFELKAARVERAQ